MSTFLLTMKIETEEDSGDLPKRAGLKRLKEVQIFKVLFPNTLFHAYPVNLFDESLLRLKKGKNRNKLIY